MSTTDSIGNMLTTLRNASNVGFKEVTVPFSKMKQSVLTVLKNYGFIQNFESVEDDKKYFLKVSLKYGPGGKKVINNISRVSTPGRRVYLSKQEIPRLRNGFGVVILTTNKGIMAGKEARKQNVGGEILCEVW